jgi:hypothetical protein
LSFAQGAPLGFEGATKHRWIEIGNCSHVRYIGQNCYFV